ncbi:hypothetical protein TNCV_3839561 [Trichonephila clavipes]|nr:hypothetical protein TNCV_3839561 [Trichonephila clavipes]
MTLVGTLVSERERNLAKENGETQQTNINDENMQNLDDQQNSEKCIVQPEDIKFLETNELILDNCREQLFDNSANISGRYTGVQALLKEKNEFANYVPCAAHSRNLFGAESIKGPPDIVSPGPPKGHGPALDTAYPGRWIGRGEALVARIAVVAGEIQEMPGVFANVRHSLRQRCDACIFAGGHFYE